MTAQEKFKNVHSRKYWLVFAAAFFTCFCVHAFIVGPYTANSDTLHLWHLDEAAVPAVDSAASGINLSFLNTGATLGGASFTGFGNALNTGVGTTNAYLAPSSGATTLTYADATTGAFTYEAVVRVDFNPDTITSAQLNAQPMYIVTCESATTGQRPWQWGVLAPASAGGILNLRFFAGGSGAPNNFGVTIPRTGPDAIVQGSWYHVAVTFSGGATTGTAKQYWTLMDTNRALAAQVGADFTLSKLVPLSSATPTFRIGNVGRAPAFQRWIGLIDEVRFSKVALSATNMMFNSFNVVISQDPVSQSLAVGQTANFSVTDRKSVV